MRRVIARILRRMAAMVDSQLDCTCNAPQPIKDNEGRLTGWHHPKACGLAGDWFYVGPAGGQP